MTDHQPKGPVLWLAAGLLGGIIAAALAGTVYFLAAGARARHRTAIPEPSPVPAPVSSAAKPRPAPPPKPVAQAAPASSPSEAEPRPPFDGGPLAWSCSKDQQILLNESPAPGGGAVLVILGTDYSVQGTLFLNGTRPVLPSNFILKDEAWGQARHFGGQDVLLGIATFKGTYDDYALRRSVASASWWKGKAKPAFQMNY